MEASNGLDESGPCANGCNLDNEWGSGYGVSGDGTAAVGGPGTARALKAFAGPKMTA